MVPVQQGATDKCHEEHQGACNRGGADRQCTLKPGIRIFRQTDKSRDDLYRPKQHKKDRKDKWKHLKEAIEQLLKAEELDPDKAITKE
jgi:hypothetical protein